MSLKKSGSKIYSSLETLPNFFIGLEIEMSFIPSSKRLREIMIEERIEVDTFHQQEVRRLLYHKIEKILPFWVERFYEDGLNDELVTHPISFLAWKEIDLQETLDKLSKYYEFKSSMYEEVGIHHTIECPENLEQTMLSFFFCRDLIYNISGRENYSTRLCDFDWMLGNRGKEPLPEKALENKFRSDLRLFLSSESMTLCNINRKKNLLELRWWGTSNNARVVLTQIECTHALLSFIPESLGYFVEAVHDHNKIYPNLSKTLDSLRPATRKSLLIG